MRWFLKSLISVTALALVGGAMAAKPDEPKGAKSDEKGKKKEKGKDKEKSEPEPAGQSKPKLAIPLIPGHDSKGLKIPYYDETGNLQMVFNIGVATRLGPDQVKMSETAVETYNDEGEQEMTIDLPVSTLDLSTRVITSQTKTTIRREDFVITGDAVRFNTITKEGTLVGNVHMTIYDLNAEVAPEGKDTPAAAETPAASPAAPKTNE